MGNYTCVLENEVGDMPSENFVYVSIYCKYTSNPALNSLNIVIVGSTVLESM